MKRTSLQLQKVLIEYITKMLQLYEIFYGVGEIVFDIGKSRDES